MHRIKPEPVDLLGRDEVGSHPLIVEETALGSVKGRGAVLDLLANLYQFPVVGNHEILHLTQQRQLWGRGLSVVDVHLMAAVTLVPGSQLWTRDKRLRAACLETAVSLFTGR